MKIIAMDSIDEQVYEDFLESSGYKSFFVSYKYLLLLEEMLDSEKRFITLLDGDKIAGVLPILIKDGKLGKICNSLPYYGSNGGVLTVTPQNKELILGYFNQYCLDNDIAASTIITSPFEKDLQVYNEYTDYDYRDYRTGQLTELPPQQENLGEALMSLFKTRTRTAIRKAIKNGVEVFSDQSAEILTYLFETHTENMNAVGGVGKSLGFFQAIDHFFTYGKGYKIYYAKLNGEVISACLLFYHGRIVEYYTPAITSEYRSLQPLSTIIFTAMQDAVNAGYSWWNWGGTGINMDGVYAFKSSWGAIDMPYYYYTKLYDKKLLESSGEQLMQLYPNYYVVSFKELNS